ncbi:hypothetical protein K491DRAFT_516630 [Lophiostoma macrostomum CBS 122681]|uniref:Uncharacterized protein n=1 Tax=Lophiostoma macrostomum CBS 122681 TaxID=1314788 RepID=A0A6A6T3R8_9PLEO|nr:hypothetical protein K491DRAFT_516630 [Lophiostoma macrostomum CBS 122681]
MSPAKSSNSKPSQKPGVDEKEVKHESSKAANSALEAQKKAKRLKDSAAGAGDPDERQKLMEQAMDAQIEAESFGKTAKYMRSGTFQGMAVGTGLGVAPGASLGALTGTLVGGVSSTILGGLGAGIGSAAGFMHGPFVNLGEMAGKGIKKATGINSWGWKASPEQKKVLEKMVGQVNEQDMPSEEELEQLGGDAKGESWGDSAIRLGSWMMGGGEGKGQEIAASAAKEGMGQVSKVTGSSKDDSVEQKDASKKTSTSQGGGGQKKPRKLERKQSQDQAHKQDAKPARKSAPKLEKRSNGSSKESNDKSKDQDMSSKNRQLQSDLDNERKENQALREKVTNLEQKLKEKS